MAPMPVEGARDFAFTEHFAVIAGEHDDRVVPQAHGLERIEQAADLSIDVGDHAVVGMPGRAQFMLADERFLRTEMPDEQ